MIRPVTIEVNKAALTGRVSVAFTLSDGMTWDEVPGAVALPLLERAVEELREALGKPEASQPPRSTNETRDLRAKKPQKTRRSPPH